MAHRPLMSCALAAMLCVGMTACSSDSDESGATSVSGATLTISGRAFSAVTVQAKQPITVVNEDGFSHTVTDRDGAFDVELAGGNSLTFTIDEPGTYSIYCTIHPDMAGTLVVG